MKLLTTLMMLVALAASAAASVTANLVIVAPEGTDDPQSAADGGLNAAYGVAQLNFFVKGGSGNVHLDSLATNSQVTEIFDWGNRLDVLGETFLEGSPLAYVPDVDVKITITVRALRPDGNNGRLKADNGRGFGVEGSNPHRLDWNVNNATSETLKIDVDTTALPSTYRLAIESLILGNGEGDAIPRIVDFAGGVSDGGLVTQGTEFELGGTHQLIGGRFSSLYLRQAKKPPQGDDGFSLQGIVFDVLPYYGEWAGHYYADELGNTSTLSLLGWVNAGSSGWVWSYNFSAWFYVAESWVSHQGSWAYMPAASEAALGEVIVVEPDWIWVQTYNRWIYRPASGASASGSWIFIFDL
jgi:opacity protein-like surface antigen